MTGSVLRDDTKPLWWQEALVATVTGAVLSLLVSFIMTIGSAAGLEPFKTMERLGADFGMQWMWALRLDDAQEDRTYIFIDVDTTACTRFQPSLAATAKLQSCLSGRTIPASLIADIIDAAAKSQAAAVILDVAPYETKEEQGLVDAAIGRIGSAKSPYFLLPQAGRPGIDIDGNNVFNRTPATATHRANSLGPLRLVSVQFDDGAAGDGLIRRYGRTTTTVGVGPVPTAPWLAALMMSRTTRAAADCRYYLRCEDVSPTDREMVIAAEQRGANLPTIFSLPSLALGASEVSGRPSVERRRWGESEDWFSEHLHYKRLVASELLSDGNGHFKSSRFEPGALIVVGSSAPAAVDFHQTPIGSMTGSEVILNAARAFDHQLRAKSEARPALMQVLEKVVAIARGSFFMLLFWLLIHFIRHHTHAHTLGRRLLADGAIALIFAGAIAVALVVELRLEAEHLRQSLAHAQPVDLLTPIFALGLEGYADAVRTMVDRVERLTLWIVRAVGGRLGKRATNGADDFMMEAEAAQAPPALGETEHGREG